MTTVAEAAFQHRLWIEGLALLDGLADLRVIRCRVDAEARPETGCSAGGPSSRPGLPTPTSSTWPPRRRSLRWPSDVPTLDVDTADGYRPELPAVIAFCRR